jgi:hypothetical protein
MVNQQAIPDLFPQHLNVQILSWPAFEFDPPLCPKIYDSCHNKSEIFKMRYAIKNLTNESVALVSMVMKVKNIPPESVATQKDLLWFHATRNSATKNIPGTNEYVIQCNIL